MTDSNHAKTRLRVVYPLPVEDWPNDKAFMCLERIVSAQNLAYGYDQLYEILQMALDEFRATFPEVWDKAVLADKEVNS